MSSLQIRLLGRFTVSVGEEPLAEQAWRSRQARTLLKILLVHPGAVITSDRIIDYVWPDADPERGRQRLHVRMSDLRRALGRYEGEVIETVDGGYRFAADENTWIDTVAFVEQVGVARRQQESGERAAAVSTYESALALYQGDLLPEDLYAPWAAAGRERLREQYLTALTELAECYAQQGRFRRAIAACRQALSQDEAREALYLRLMLYYYYSGDRAQALRTYARCRQVLADQLGVAPLPATARVADQIEDGTLWRAGNVPRYPPPVYAGRLFDIPFSLGTPPFTGRERAYAWLVERWRTLDTGVLLVMGESGIGKTRLVAEFAGFAQQQGATCVRVALAAARTWPYTAVSLLWTQITPRPDRPPALTRAHWAALAPVLPRLEPPDSLPELPVAAARALLPEALDLLLRHHLPPGTVVVLDDAHDADPASLQLLARLENHLFLVVTVRSETASAQMVSNELSSSLQQSQLQTITLSPLEEAAVSGLVRRLAGHHLASLTDLLVRQTGGNPLFLVAVLHHLFETGGLYVDTEGRWQLTDVISPALPPTVTKTVEARMQQLGQMQRRVLDLAAVAGGAFDFALMQQAGGWDEAVLLEAIEALMTAGLLVEPRTSGEPEFAVASELYARVALSTLPQVHLRRLHLEVAAALAATTADPGAAAPALATHYREAGAWPEARHWLLQAGDAAHARYAYAEALAFYRQALALKTGESASIWQKLGHLTHQLGRYAESARFYERALARWRLLEETVQQVRTRYGLAENYRELSRYSAAQAQAEAGLALARKMPDGASLEAEGHVILSNALRSGQLAPAADVARHLEAALALAQPIGLSQVVGEANFWLGVVAINRGNAEAALTYDRQALAAFVNNGRSDWEAIACNNTAYHALQAGQAALALGMARRGLTLAREIGSRKVEGWLLSTLGEVQLHLALLPQAEETLQAGLEHARRWGPPRLVPGMLHDLARVALARNQWQKAQTWLLEALAEARETAPQFLPRLRLSLAAALLGGGEASAAETAVRQALRTAEAKGQQQVTGEAWRLLGRLRAARGEEAAADRAFARSYHLLSRINNPLEMARTQAAWIAVASRNGTDVAPVLAQARNAFTACSAYLDLQTLTNL